MGGIPIFISPTKGEYHPCRVDPETMKLQAIIKPEARQWVASQTLDTIRLYHKPKMWDKYGALITGASFFVLFLIAVITLTNMGVTISEASSAAVGQMAGAVQTALANATIIYNGAPPAFPQAGI